MTCRPRAPLAVLLATALAASLVPSLASAGSGSRLVVPDWGSMAAGKPIEPADLVRYVLPADFAGDLVVAGESSGAGGLRHVRVRQVVAGVPVFHGDHVAVLSPSGEPMAVLLGELSDPGTPGPFVLDAAQAATIGEAAVAGRLDSLPPAVFAAGKGASLGATVTDGGAEGWLAVSLAGVAHEARASRTILPAGPTAAWRVHVAERDDPEERWCVLVDATSGSVLEILPLTRHVAATARVYPRGYLAGAQVVPFADDDTILDPASPAGWVAVDATDGNNATAWDDRTGDGTATTGLLARGTGTPLSFDFPVTGVPANDLDAALTNAFWAVNVAHDRFAALGFDPASGAMQAQGWSRGGASNDPLKVFVQSRATAAVNVARNSNASTTGLDGGYSSISIGLWDKSGTLRDGALDTGTIFHEYAHHVVTRMAGGDPTCDDGTQPGGLAEGWADYFAASWTGDPVIGTWVSGDDVHGLRTQPIDGNAYSYSNLCNVSSTACNAFENGEIWTGTLWDLRRALIRAHGPVEGAERADRLVVEGLRWTPCRPTYPDARDGILMADLALSGGVDHCLVWQAMAGRGLGKSATTTGPADQYPVPGFDVPGECAAGTSLRWERPRYGDDAVAGLLLGDATAAGAARTVRVSATPSGDVEDVVAAADARGPGLLRRVAVTLAPGMAVPGDGVLQVADGDTLTAQCTDCSRAPRAMATVSRALDVRVLTHQLSSESCQDDDDAAGLSDFKAELPSLLDAGELATIAVTLGNAESFPLEDVRVSVTCDNPNVKVLPAGEVRVGAVRAQNANPWPFILNLRALAAPLPAVQPGDTATLTFDVSARGLHAVTTLKLDLAGDYAAERGVAAFGATETFEAASTSARNWTHAPAAGQPGDQWSIQGCGNGGGKAMVYAGTGCGSYADTPSAATLVSPPLIDTSNGVLAVHPLQMSWFNDVGLGRDPRTLYCDSEEVLLYLTSDPARPAYGNPRGDRTSATQYWVQWDAFGDRRNTTGYAAAGPRNALTATSLAGMSLPNVRAYWVFFTDVYRWNADGCPSPGADAVGSGYKLDDVSFTYDLARLVPAANTTCTATCGVRAALTVAPAGGARCPGDPVTLSAEASEAAGCTGTLQYRFTGPGLDTGYTSSPTAIAIAAGAATWTVAVRCSADTACAQSIAVADPTLDDAHAGRVRMGSLRLSRQGDDVLLAWDGTAAPVAYATFRTDSAREDAAARIATLRDLALSPPADPLRHGSADALTWRDAGAAHDGMGLHVYRVLTRIPCAGTALDR